MAGILKVDRVQSDSNLAFQIGSSNVAYFNTTGLNITGGEIIAGGSTLRTTGGMLYANSGIAFPGTQAASADPNTLDDYEEGTWTPIIRGASTAGTYTLGAGWYGYYTKIGRVVTVSFETSIITVVSPGTNYLQIDNLPFFKMASSNFIGSLNTSALDYGGTATGVCLEFTSATSVNTLYIRGIGDSYSGIDTPVSGITSGSTYLRGTITYFAV